MKDNSRIIEIDGKKYAIDCTFDNSPAIYRGEKIVTDGHVSEKSKPLLEMQLDLKNHVVVITREIK